MIKPVDFPKIYAKLMPEFQQALEQFIMNGEYIGGSLVERFEDKVRGQLGAEHVIACKSGTHALQLALIAAGIGAGDEVVTVANTYYATAYAVLSVGAIPVFCEVLPDSGLIDPAAIESKLSPKTKAILPVHLYGAPADLDAIRDICDRHGLQLIEDCAHAFGSSYHGTPIGAEADFACFSLYPTKNLGAFGDAGMVVSRSAGHAEKIREVLYLCDAKRTSFPPRAIHAMLDPLQAILLSVVLEHFPEYRRQRQEIAGVYRRELAGVVRMLPEPVDCEVVPYVFPVFTEKRKELFEYMKSQDIHLQVHYDIDLHRMPQFGRAAAGSLPITEQHNRETLSLSVHPSVSVDDARATCQAIKTFVKQNKL
jgi:dTDP-4-amino-4,6-dideoxygalactose transaminase